MSRFISQQTVQELTGRKTAPAQVKVLRELGFTVMWVKGQTPKVAVENFLRISGGAPANQQKQAVKLNFQNL